MKKLNIFIIGLMVFMVGMITACKKNKDNTTTTATSKPNDQQGSSAADGVIDNVNDFINNKIGGGSTKRVATYNLPCGVVLLDSSTISGGYKVYKMQYGSQTPCGYQKKSGQVSFVLINGTAFNSAGATFKLTYTDYVVVSLATGETTTINGTLTIKNVNGGYIWEAVTVPSTITYQLRGTFSVTYSDGTIRARSYYQLRTYSNTSTAGDWKGLTLSIGGDTLTNVYEIGKTYDGNYDYQTELITNFKWSNCGTTYAGPYILKAAHARMNLTIPLVTPAYIDIEGGYYWNYSNVQATPTLVNDCTTDAYKITTVVSTATTSVYQLY